MEMGRLRKEKKTHQVKLEGKKGLKTLKEDGVAEDLRSQGHLEETRWSQAWRIGCIDEHMVTAKTRKRTSGQRGLGVSRDHGTGRASLAQL